MTKDSGSPCSNSGNLLSIDNEDREIEKGLLSPPFVLLTYETRHFSCKALTAYQRPSSNLKTSLLFALVIHGVLLLLLILGWRQGLISKKEVIDTVIQQQQRLLQKTQQAYLITSIETPSNNVAPKEAEKLSSSVNAVATAPVITHALKSNSGTQAAIDQMQAIEIAESVKQAEGQKTIETDKAADSLVSKSQKEKPSSPSKSYQFQRYTQQYLVKEQAQAFEELVKSQANAHGATRSMSELDGDMEQLWVSKFKPTAEERISRIANLDLALDPNRRVRIGDTCYQVVQVGNQINPYAENLGYAFDCGEDKVQQQLDALIEKRTKASR